MEPIKQGLRRLGLFGIAKRLYTTVADTAVLRSGEYPIEIGDTSAVYHVSNHTELNRLRSMTERDVMEQLLSDLRDDDVFYDIGANVGIYSCLVGDRLPENSVYAFEPHPANVARLSENLRLNGIHATIFQKALSDSEGEVNLSVAVESHTTAPSHNLLELTESIEAYGEGSAERTSVDMLRGDGLVANRDVPAPTVLKVDVEGAEYNVLKGFEETLRRDECRLVYCEVHLRHLPKFDASEDELLDLLKSYGFELTTIDDRGDKYHLRASK
ncbi:FkbM family methyltransferase [Halorientalis regularis]|uniref:Methyltransferase, FkbM family n=1 Tax=Halorientalis regularis TaxID=660518 RepID=A0A1G7HFJ9_9EURY|nr:FkbM family methyltransferase [Halorientalis regularis]SDE99252.1 methyltransferase, FkbM family [Halorientalis regularis]